MFTYPQPLPNFPGALSTTGEVLSACHITRKAPRTGWPVFLKGVGGPSGEEIAINGQCTHWPKTYWTLTPTIFTHFLFLLDLFLVIPGWFLITISELRRGRKQIPPSLSSWTILGQTWWIDQGEPLWTPKASKRALLLSLPPGPGSSLPLSLSLLCTIPYLRLVKMKRAKTCEEFATFWALC